MRLASTHLVEELARHAHEDLRRIVALWPFVAEQKLVGESHGAAIRLANGTITVANLPQNLTCDRPHCDGRPHGDWCFHHPAHDHMPSPAGHSDRVGETVASARRQIELDDRTAQLTVLDALDRIHTHTSGLQDALTRLGRARIQLAGRVIAIDTAINAHQTNPKLGRGPDGRIGTSGVSQDEADRQKKGAVEAETACLCCQLGVTEIGRLRAGLCSADYQAWLRAGQPERGPWIITRRNWLEQKAENGAEIIRLRVDPTQPYRDGLKEVA